MLDRKDTCENKTSVIRGIGFLCIAAGLVYCSFTGQVDASGLQYIVYPVIGISVILGLAQVIKETLKGGK